MLNETIRIWLSPAQKKALLKLAKESKKTASELVRLALTKVYNIK